MVKVERLQRRFGKVLALEEVTFQVAKGHITGLIGPNGAGKTTTMRILATLEMADRGHAWINGAHVVEEPEKVVREIGFMPDAFGNYPGLLVEEYLEFFARIYSLHGRARRQALDEVIAFTDLGKLLDRPMEALSKGMRQRLGLAKTMLHDPELFILDEPAAGLDPRARIEFRELCVALAARGKTLLISSHILSELGEFCDSIVILERGRVVASGSLDEVRKCVRSSRSVEVHFVGEPPAATTFLTEYPLVRGVHAEGHKLRFDFDGSEEQLAALAEALMKAGHRFADFHCREQRLEDLFMKLTNGDVS